MKTRPQRAASSKYIYISSPDSEHDGGNNSLFVPSASDTDDANDSWQPNSTSEPKKKKPVSKKRKKSPDGIPSSTEVSQKKPKNSKPIKNAAPRKRKSTQNESKSPISEKKIKLESADADTQNGSKPPISETKIKLESGDTNFEQNIKSEPFAEVASSSETRKTAPNNRSRIRKGSERRVPPKKVKQEPCDVKPNLETLLENATATVKTETETKPNFDDLNKATTAIKRETESNQKSNYELKSENLALENDSKNRIKEEKPTATGVKTEPQKGPVFRTLRTNVSIFKISDQGRVKCIL